MIMVKNNSDGRFEHLGNAGRLVKDTMLIFDVTFDNLNDDKFQYNCPEMRRNAGWKPHQLLMITQSLVMGYRTCGGICGHEQGTGKTQLF